MIPLTRDKRAFPHGKAVLWFQQTSVEERPVPYRTAEIFIRISSSASGVLPESSKDTPEDMPL